MKQIPLFDGRFYIDENGNIYNSFTNNFITPYITNKGYKVVDLNYNGKRKKMLVHRLVAICYVENPNNDPIVLHLDSNPLNCNYNNLKWGTYSENNKQAIIEGHMKVPTPDNRKQYVLHEDSDNIVCAGYLCNGVNEVIDKIGFGNDSSIRNYIFRHSKIPKGKYKNWKIELFK